MGNPFNVTEKEDYADISLFEFAFVCSTARNGRHALFVRNSIFQTGTSPF